MGYALRSSALDSSNNKESGRTPRSTRISLCSLRESRKKRSMRPVQELSVPLRPFILQYSSKYLDVKLLAEIY